MSTPLSATLCPTPASVARSVRRSATLRRTFDPAAFSRPVLESALYTLRTQEALYFFLSGRGIAPVLLDDFRDIVRDYLAATGPYEIDDVATAPAPSYAGHGPTNFLPY